MCTSGTSPLTREMRRSCLRVCLRSLWYCAKTYHQFGDPKRLPSYFTHALASPEIIRLIQAEKDPVAHVMGRCFGALIVNNLVAYVKSRTDSNTQINDKVLGCLSAILGTESRDLKLWLKQPSAIELTSTVFLAFGDIGSLAADTVPPYVLDVVPQTFSILSQVLPAEINAELGLNQIRTLTDISDGVAPIIGEVYQDHSIRCLKNLWHCVRAYNQPGNSVPLPSYILTAFASPSMSRRIRTEQDATARVIGRCVEALVVKKLVAGVRSSTNSDVQITNEELACLSTILGTKRDDVKLCLERSGAVELASMVSLALGDVGSLANALPPDVLDVAQQTLAILSQVLPTEEMAELQLDLPIAGLNISDGIFDHVIVSHLYNLLQMCTSDTSPLTPEVRRSCLRMCLKSLWYCAKAYHQLGASQQLPSYFPRTLAGPEIIRLIQTEQDPISRVTVCYFGALVAKKLAVGVRSHTDSSVQIIDEELACLSAILGTESDDVRLCLTWLNAVELTSMVSLALGDVGSLATDALPSNVLNMAQQTLAILSHVLPAEETAELQLDLPIARLNILDGKFGRMIASRLLSLLQMCKSGTSPYTAEVRRSCLRMCLKSLWYCARAYHQLGASERLPSYFPHTLASPEVIHLIQAEQDPVSRVIGRCFEALVLKKLLAGVKSSTDSGIQISDEELACLSAILGTKRDDVKLCLEWPGAVELASMVSLSLGDIGSLVIDALPPNALDVAQQTLGILSQVLIVEETAELPLDLPIARFNISEGKIDRVIVSHLHNLLQMCISGTSPLTTEVRRSCLWMCLKSLWYCAKTYNQLDAPEWLPSYFTLALASPEIIRLIQAEKDPVAHVIGSCFGDVDREQSGDLRQIAQRLKCSIRRRDAGVPLSYPWHREPRLEAFA
ncbi:hypothetical protein H4582DRAFT_543915 [Lactarius indigo]|nr:hypothetical protein H4582DRAFT_543915 [Lactarius indigo]